MQRARLALALAGLATGGVQAAGFALIEQNASGLGNAYAGQAAAAEDASTIYFNPAGLTYQSGKEAVVVLHAIKPTAEFSDGGSAAASGLNALGGEGGDAGSLAPVPNLFLAMDLSPKVRLGLGVSAPFGLKTEYDATWIGRFQAVESDLKTLNVNPTLAYKLNDAWSVGGGVNLQRIQATLSNMANYAAFVAVASGNTILLPGSEGLATVEGDDWGWGGNLGLMFSPSPDLRLGAGYRSRINYTLEGDVRFAGVPTTLNAGVDAALAAQFANGGVTAKVTMPDTLALSLFKRVNSTWDLLADATWTNWSVFDTLAVNRSNGTPLTATPENWDDTWRYSLGANYHANRNLTWRFGLAYDQSPVPNANRTARIPDEDRTWLAVGGQYRYKENSILDFGYAHIFVKEAGINQTAAGAGTLLGSYDNSVDILSVQYTRRF
ncbi:MAG: outer membrane protein transport protein [Pseudomonadota bacterium]